MILRARPKFLVEDFFHSQVDTTKTDRMYFNYGRTALAFVLQTYSNHLSKRLSVGIQSFNCEVIAWAVLTTNNDLHLLDIKKEDFSLDLYNLQKCNLDVLVLTHYQGIPNSEYDKIVEYCAVHNILLIDDVAQAENSYYKGELVGTLADFSIHSFSFDKPYTSWTGGELKVQKCQDVAFVQLLKKKYLELEIENIQKESLDVKLLHFLWIYSDVHRFHIELNNRNLVRACISLHIPFKYLNRIMIYSPRKVINVLDRMIGKFQNSKIKVERLGCKKIILLEKQELRSLKKMKYNIPELITKGEELFYRDDRFINWNRYSLLDESGEIKKILLENGIEVGNYNWPEPLDVKLKRCSHVFLHGNYKITHYVAKNILNIPIWPYLKIHEE